jgi:hypothetical protein
MLHAYFLKILKLQIKSFDFKRRLSQVEIDWQPLS